MSRHAWIRTLGIVVTVGLLAAACGNDGDDSGSGGGGGGPVPEGAIVVPDDHDTIQAAVDAASEGDLVYVREGTYTEGVIISTPNIVVRGADRNETVIDGDFEHENCVMIPETDGVAIENLTVTNCIGNGVFFTGVDGYRVSYVNSVRAGFYGIYAFDSVNGRFEHSYASGSADSGFYIGQCDPCNAVIDDVVAEWNGLGYSGTNAGGDLFVVDSTWRENRMGIVPNSLTSELYYPQREVVIAGNSVHDNNNLDAPAVDLSERVVGAGILVAGGTNNLVTHNLVENNETANIAVVTLPEKSLLRPEREEAIDFDATGNRVVDNTVGGESRWDIAVAPSLTDPSDNGGNCFSGNDPATSAPEDLEELLPCDADPSPEFVAPVDQLAEVVLGEHPGPPVEDVDLPDYVGEQMPDADSAPPVPATQENLDLEVDVEAISTPPADGDE